MALYPSNAFSCITHASEDLDTFPCYDAIRGSLRVILVVAT